MTDDASLLLRALAPATSQLSEDDRHRWASDRLVERLLPVIEHEDAGPWLAARLVELNVRVSSAFEDALRAVQRRAAANTLLLQNEVHEVARVLSSSGVPFVLLKGAARAFMSSAPLARARTAHDCDVLVRQQDVSRALNALADAGYRRTERRAPAGHWHADPMERGGMPVELHHALGSSDEPGVIWDRHAGGPTVAAGDLVLRLPPSTEMLWHTLQHRLNSPSGWLCLRHWFDVASLLHGVPAPQWIPLQERVAALAPDARERLGGFVRAVSIFAGVRLDRELGLADGPHPDLAAVLAWRVRALRAGKIGGGRLKESLLEAVYRWSGDPADWPRPVRSPARRLLDRATDLAWQLGART